MVYYFSTYGMLDSWSILNLSFYMGIIEYVKKRQVDILSILVPYMQVRRAGRCHAVLLS